jgi:hypothetical protein
MDPIHPIVPQSPTLPPVTPAPRADAVNRDGGRQGSQQQPRRRQPAAGRPQTAPRLGVPAAGDEPEDARPHVDITV